MHQGALVLKGFVFGRTTLWVEIMLVLIALFLAAFLLFQLLSKRRYLKMKENSFDKVANTSIISCKLHRI